MKRHRKHSKTNRRKKAKVKIDFLKIVEITFYWKIRFLAFSSGFSMIPKRIPDAPLNKYFIFLIGRLELGNIAFGAQWLSQCHCAWHAKRVCLPAMVQAQWSMSTYRDPSSPLAVTDQHTVWATRLGTRRQRPRQLPSAPYSFARNTHDLSNAYAFTFQCLSLPTHRNQVRRACRHPWLVRLGHRANYQGPMFQAPRLRASWPSPLKPRRVTRRGLWGRPKHKRIREIAGTHRSYVSLMDQILKSGP